MTTTLPTLDGFEEFFGVPVCALGEDGDLVALGHYSPTRAVKAMNAYARKLFGQECIVEPRNAPGWTAEGEVDRLFATVEFDTDGDWRITASSTPSRDSIPVMYWSA